MSTAMYCITLHDDLILRISILTFICRRCLHHVGFIPAPSIISPIIFVPTLIIFHLETFIIFLNIIKQLGPARQVVEVLLHGIAAVHPHAADDSSELVQSSQSAPQPPGSHHPQLHRGELALAEPFWVVDSER